MENGKPYTRREDCYLGIKNCSQIIYNNYPKVCYKRSWKNNKAFLWQNSTTKIKDETFFNKKDGGLKNFDIQNKIIALQYSWIKGLYNNSFHEWKLIPLNLI